MSKFNPSKLTVTFFPPATPFKPVDERKYTLTHNDITGEMSLTIGYCYDMGAIQSTKKDEVIAEWTPQLGQYVLKGKVHISNGEFDEQGAKSRFLIFQRELPLALTAIVYGDRQLYQYYPWLLDSPIYVQFESSFPNFHRLMYLGTPRHYLSSALQPTPL